MSHLNLYWEKFAAGLFAGFVGLLVNDLLPLFIDVTVFVAVDFITGVLKSAVVAKRTKQKFAFESIKAWRTIYKYVFILIGIVLAEMLDQTVANESRLRFAKYFTAFCCGVEFWSFLENAAVISDHPLFRWLRRFMKFKLEDEIGMTFEDAQKPGKDEICASCQYNVAGTCTLKPKDLEKCPLRNEETKH